MTSLAEVEFLHTTYTLALSVSLDSIFRSHLWPRWLEEQAQTRGKALSAPTSRAPRHPARWESHRFPRELG